MAETIFQKPKLIGPAIISMIGQIMSVRGEEIDSAGVLFDDRFDINRQTWRGRTTNGSIITITIDPANG